MLVLTVVMAGLAVVVAAWFPSQQLQALAGGSDLPDLQPWRDPDALLAQIDAYGEVGRRLYLTHVTPVDVVIPVAQMLFLAVGTALLLRRVLPKASRWHLLALVPLLAMVGDYGENVAFGTLMWIHPVRFRPLAAASTWFTALKFGGAAASIAIAIALLLILVIARTRRA